EIQLYVGDDVIILTPQNKSSYLVKYNNKSFQLFPLKSVSLNEQQLIFAYLIDEASNIIQVDARRAGVKITYNGKNVQVEVSLKYKGELCGLCGDFNGEKLREYRGVSGCLYSDSGDFAKSCTIGNCTKLSPDNPHICKGNAMYSDIDETATMEEQLDDTEELPPSFATNMGIQKA
ncbi:DNA-directed RNA polymerase subunit alpha, partial [Nephila pilipes]